MSQDWLDQMIGDWTYEGRSVPDNPEQLRTGTETVTRRGAWLIIEADDHRFQLAFNSETNRVVGDFVHWDYANLWVYDGCVETDGALHLGSRGPSFDEEGAQADYDDVYEILSSDARRLTSRVKGGDGEWRDFCVTDYRRKT